MKIEVENQSHVVFMKNQIEKRIAAKQNVVGLTKAIKVAKSTRRMCKSIKSSKRRKTVQANSFLGGGAYQRLIRAKAIQVQTKFDLNVNYKAHIAKPTPLFILGKTQALTGLSQEILTGMHISVPINERKTGNLEMKILKSRPAHLRQWMTYEYFNLDND